MRIGPILRALGINVTEEHIKMVEDLIPQIPTKLNVVVTTINQAIQHFDGRLQAIEKQNAEILELLKNGTRNTPG